MSTSDKRFKRFKKLRVLNLYWVKSGFGFEDWFIIARSRDWARRYFNYFEGFDEDDSESAFVMDISKNLIEKYNLKYFNGAWPDHNLLKDLGFKFISEINPRILNFNGKVYKEAYNTEVYTFEKLEKKSGVYIIRLQNTDNYKIGITTDLKTRIRQFKTSSTYQFEMVYFIETINYKTLEKDLHNFFCNYRSTGEWFLFDLENFQKLKGYIKILIDTYPDLYELHNIKNVGKYYGEY